MNTLVPFMYRDACNYKACGHVVFAGEPTPELIRRLLRALEDGALAVPVQVGIEHPVTHNAVFMNRFPDREDDHGYVELWTEEIEPTSRPITDARSFNDFVEQCEAIGVDGWDPQQTIDAFGGWRDPEECARKR